MHRKISYLSLLFILPICLISSLAFAAPWKFEIDPYLWAVNLNGRVGVGPATAHVNDTFSDLVNHLDFAAMVYAAAHKDRFGVYVNAIYAALSDDASIDGISIDAKAKLGIFGAGLSYVVYQKQYTYLRKSTIEAYAGARYTLNNTTVNVSHFSFRKDVNWTDPIIGLRLIYDFNKQWFLNLSGDVGGTSRATDSTYSAMGLLGYHPQSWTNTSLYLGYRILDQHYQTGRGLNFYNWDMKLFGPLAGFRFEF